MPLVREQRDCLARVMSWSRAHGWTHDAYPNSWRRTDGRARVRFDPEFRALIVDYPPPTSRAAWVPVDSPEVAVDVLAALGHVPAHLSPLASKFICTDPACPCASTEGDADFYALELGDDPDAFDGPASFLEAGQAFADLVDGRVSAERAAEVLSRLARDGLIVSVTYHEEACAGQAIGSAGGAEVAGQMDLMDLFGDKA